MVRDGKTDKDFYFMGAVFEVHFHITETVKIHQCVLWPDAM